MAGSDGELFFLWICKVGSSCWPGAYAIVEPHDHGYLSGALLIIMVRKAVCQV